MDSEQKNTIDNPTENGKKDEALSEKEKAAGIALLISWPISIIVVYCIMLNAWGYDSFSELVDAIKEYGISIAVVFFGGTIVLSMFPAGIIVKLVEAACSNTTESRQTETDVKSVKSENETRSYNKASQDEKKEEIHKYYY